MKPNNGKIGKGEPVIIDDIDLNSKTDFVVGDIHDKDFVWPTRIISNSRKDNIETKKMLQFLNSKGIKPFEVKEVGMSKTIGVGKDKNND